MDVGVRGGHGGVAGRLLALSAARGARARGIVRNPAHGAILRGMGAEPLLADLERDDITSVVEGADAVVMAAGAGPLPGGAVKLIHAAKATGVTRYVMISSMGASDPSTGSAAMRPYLEAKGEADAELAASGLNFTIVRPGRLTDDAGTGRIEAAERLDRRGAITRDDTAATLVALLDTPSTIGLAFEVLEGRTPIVEAIAALPA